MKARIGWLMIVALAAFALWRFSIHSVENALQWGASVTGIPYNTLIILLGTGTLGLAGGVVGTFAVLRRQALVGDAAAHAALPGLALAFMATGERNFVLMLLGAMTTGLLGSTAISWLQKNTRIKSDAAIGIVLSVLFGLGIVLSRIVQDNPSGQQAGLDSFLLGKTAGMVSQDLFLISLVALTVVIVIAVLYKEFKIVSFDPQFASVQGLPVLFLDILMTALLVVITVIGLPAVGVVLMAALLIIPGVSARFWTDRLHVMVGLAALFGLVTGVAGTALSATYADLPAGAVIVLTGTSIFAFSMFFAPKRGIFARMIQVISYDFGVAGQNLLRTMYETIEPGDHENGVVTMNDILRKRAWSAGQAGTLLFLAARRLDVEPVGKAGWRLTEKGLKRAKQTVRAHRLWEIFLVEHASAATDHVHRDADDIEHILTPDLVRALESKLASEGRLPKADMPASVHPVGEERLQ